MDKHLIVISADSHAGAAPEQYTQYLEKQYRAAYEETIGAGDADEERVSFDTPFEDGGLIHSREAIKEYKSRKGIDGNVPGGTIGQWDSDVRIKQLEDDGVVAEVLFPNASPFMRIGIGVTGQNHENIAAGKRAYNRWIAEFCAEQPDRRAGLALVDTYDIPGAIAETERAAKAGLKGILVPHGLDAVDMPLYDPQLEPLWDAAESLDMIVHVHGGGAPVDYKVGDRVLHMMLQATESFEASANQLAYMIWSGALERHPKMKFVLTEIMSGWVPGKLKWLDRAYHGKVLSYVREKLPRAPSEYWRRQCYVGASMLSAEECDMRHEIGVDHIMFGNDYPHLEGSYPNTHQWLQATVGGIPEQELRLIAGENAAAVYGFDLEKLQPIADRVGPKISDFATRRSNDRHLTAAM